MAFILAVEDEQAVCQLWRDWLLQANHRFDFAHTYDSAIEKIITNEMSDEEQEKYDLILLDHNLEGGFTGLQILYDLDRDYGLRDYGQGRVVVITAATDMNIVPEYTRLGAIGYLIKPVSQPQFNATIIQALELRSTYLSYRENWEDAIELLQEKGVIPAIDQIELELQVLRNAQDRLLQQLERIRDNREISRVLEAYRQAEEFIEQSTTQISAILPALQPFMVTSQFLSDIKEVFARRRLTFNVLLGYLSRIGQNPNDYKVTHLDGRATGHYEYRIGRNHRLYFRRENGQIVLERFTGKNSQEATIRYLRETSGGSVFTGDRQAYLLS